MYPSSQKLTIHSVRCLWHQDFSMQNSGEGRGGGRTKPVKSHLDSPHSSPFLKFSKTNRKKSERNLKLLERGNTELSWTLWCLVKKRKLGIEEILPQAFFVYCILWQFSLHLHCIPKIIRCLNVPSPYFLPGSQIYFSVVSGELSLEKAGLILNLLAFWFWYLLALWLG